MVCAVAIATCDASGDSCKRIAVGTLTLLGQACSMCDSFEGLIQVLL